MAVVKFQLNSQNLAKFTLVGIGAFLFLSPSVQAAPISHSISGVNPAISRTLINNERLLIAGTANNCLNDIAEGFSVETRNFFVGICYTPDGTFYVGQSKNGKNHILLPLTSQKGNVYVARNGAYTYTLDMNKKQLIVKFPNGRRSIETVTKVIDS